MKTVVINENHCNCLILVVELNKLVEKYFGRRSK